MELVKDIYFNTDKLIENTKVKVSYTGKFYQGNNNQVFIHYGYGKDWNNVNEVEMQKTDLGYQTELDLVGGDTLNFCFKNQNNEWDNNSGKNYIFNIEDENTTISGVIEDNVIGTPNSIDTVFNTNKAGTIETAANITNLDNGITQKITYNLGVSTPNVATKWENTKVNIINPMAKAIKNTANQAVTITKNTVNKVTTATKNYINQNQGQTENALTVTPTGFNAWTQKVKATVSKFFAYVPKLISGNYKRNISEDKN